MDEPVAKGLAEDVEGDQTRLLHVLTGGGSSRGLWLRVEEARREEQVVVAQQWHVEAKEWPLTGQRPDREERPVDERRFRRADAVHAVTIPIAFSAQRRRSDF